MRPVSAIAIAILLLLGTGTAEAASSALLAETAGFLLGNAHRCGVPADRVEHAGNVVHRLIVAASDDPTEEASANSRFAETFLASADAGEGGNVLIPPCRVVIAQFELLERHHQRLGN
jgi:hypothetical protein